MAIPDWTVARTTTSTGHLVSTIRIHSGFETQVQTPSGDWLWESERFAHTLAWALQQHADLVVEHTEMPFFTCPL